MFCDQCGNKSIEHAIFCRECGHKLENLDVNKSNHQDPVETNHVLNEKSVSKELPMLWNPNAAANWSLLFTPVFGSYLQMRNWKALGNTAEANIAKFWLFTTIGVILFLNFATPFIWSDPYALQTYPKSLGFLYIIIWYFSFAKNQSNFVKTYLKNHYEKKSWLLPLVIASIITFFSVVFLMATSSTIAQMQSEPTNSLSDNQKKPWEYDWEKEPEQISNSINPFSDPNYGKELNTNKKIEVVEQAHYDAILKVHPDAYEIAKQTKFYDWINAQPVDWKNYYSNVIESGTTDQVVEMLNDYKLNMTH